MSKRSLETRQRISEARKGTIHSEETKQKISQSMKKIEKVRGIQKEERKY